MKCELCGAENKSDSLTCSECGGALTPQNSESPKTEVKEEVNAQVSNGVAKSPKSNMGKIAVIGASLVAVLVVAFLSISFFSGAKDLMYNKTILYGREGGIKIGSYNGPMIDFNNTLNDSSYSLDRSTIAFIDEDDALHVYLDGKIESIAKDVQVVRISAHGNRVAYAKNIDESSYELYVYDLSSKENTLIDKNAVMPFGNESMSFILSPNGERIAYVSGDENGLTSYIAVVGKEAEKLGEKAFALALTDDESYLYYAKGNDEGTIDILLKTNDTEKIIQKGIGTIDMTFNLDLSQVVFNGNEGAYLSNKGADATKISKKNLGVYNYNDFAEIVDVYPYDFGDVSFTGFSDLTKSIFFAKNGDQYSDEFYYLDDTLNTQKIIGDATNCIFSANGKSLLYLKKDKLYLMDDIKAPNKAVAYDIEDVDSFISTPELKDIYFSKDDELFYFNGKDATRVGDRGYKVTINKKTGVLYYVLDNELFKVDKTKVEKIPTDGEIQLLYHHNESVLYFTETDGVSWHRSINDGEFETLYKEK